MSLPVPNIPTQRQVTAKLKSWEKRFKNSDTCLHELGYICRFIKGTKKVTYNCMTCKKRLRITK